MSYNPYGSRRRRSTALLAHALTNAVQPTNVAKVQSATYHIVYHDRYGVAHTGRVVVAQRGSAVQNRAAAIQAAHWRWPEAKRGHVSAVRVHPPA